MLYEVITGIFYKRRFAWSDTIPHCTGAANYALMLRHMLVHEQDNRNNFV